MKADEISRRTERPKRAATVIVMIAMSCSFLLRVPIGFAVDRVWVGTPGAHESWINPNAWDPIGVPAAGDVARFIDLGDKSGIAMPSGLREADQLINQNAVVTLVWTTDANGTLSLISVEPTAPSLLLGVQASDRPDLVLKGMGGTLLTADAIIGSAAESTATLTIQQGIDWQANGPVVIGQAGSGRLELLEGITSGGTTSASMPSLNLGVLAGSSGELDIHGSRSVLDVPGVLQVGVEGQGTITIENGGQLNSDHGMIAVAGQSDSAVIIRNGSAWTVEHSVSVGVGDQAQGQLQILDGSSLTCEELLMGQAPNTRGEVLLSGLNATLGVGENVIVGQLSEGGGAGLLSVANDAQLDAAGALQIGAHGIVELQGASWVAVDSLQSFSGSFVAPSPTVVRSNELIGFPNQVFGHFQLGHAIGRGFGEHVVQEGEQLTMLGTLTVGVDAPGRLTLDDGGVVTALRSFVGSGEGSDESRVIVTKDGSRWETAETLYLGGTELGPQAVASVTASDGGTVAAPQIMVWPTGVLSVDEGTVVADYVHVQGILEGNGTIQVSTGLVNEGILSPGFSLGTLQLSEGPYSQHAGAVLKIELAGTDPPQYDRLEMIHGSASLAGLLDLTPTDEYADPTERGTADVFQLISSDQGMTGVFDEVHYAGDPLIPTDGISTATVLRTHLGEGLFRIVHYDTTCLRFVNYLAIEGDATGDGQFNTADLVAVLTAGEYEDGIPQNSDWTEGDWNGDLDFTTADLVAALQAGHYELGSLFATEHQVPEPSGAPLLILALLACFRRLHPSRPPVPHPRTGHAMAPSFPAHTVSRGRERG